MTPESDRLAALLGAALLEAVDRAVARRLPAALSDSGAVAAPGFIGTAEAARRAGVKGETVLAWITRGALQASKPPGVKAWRIRPEDLEAFLAGESTGAKPHHPPPVDLAEKRAELARGLADRTRRPKGDR